MIKSLKESLVNTWAEQIRAERKPVPKVNPQSFTESDKTTTSGKDAQSISERDA